MNWFGADNFTATNYRHIIFANSCNHEIHTLLSCRLISKNVKIKRDEKFLNNFGWKSRGDETARKNQAQIEG
jgi:hypothetical protein